MAKVTMPQLGESVAEGTVGKWLKKPGDHVAKYEPLLEVITDKVNAEVPSPFEGVLREILVEEGATVPNNAEIAVIDEAGGGDATGPVAADASQPTAVASESPAPTPAGAAAPDEAPEPETTPPPRTTPEERPRGAEPVGPTAASSAPSAAATAGASPGPSAALATPAPTAHGPAGSDERARHDLPGTADARMTPAVRRLLREHGLTAAMIVGTGAGGQITREDVTDFVESQRTGQPVGKQDASAVGERGADTAAPAAAPERPAGAQTSTPAAASAPAAAGLAPAAVPAPATGTPPAPAPASSPASTAGGAGKRIEFPEGADEVLVPMTQMRKGIAAQMTRALQIPHAYVQMEVDASNLIRFRERNKADYQAREGLPLSFVPFVVKAAAEALKGNPTFNAHWTEQGLLAKRRLNVGIAVAVEDGLIVPVIRDVDDLSISGINKAIADVSARARAGRLRVDDFGGGTFTVDNTGWLGTNMVMPIINPPEVAIVTMDRITKRPVVVETPDGDVIAIRHIMNMVLAVDHRANDGAGGAAFLRDVKAWLEAVGPEIPIY